jgi:transposase
LTNGGKFCFLAGLCPDNGIGGGRVLWKEMPLVKNRASQMFRLATSSLHNSQMQTGHYLRPMKAKLGPAPAITATAHEIALVFYSMVKNREEYDALLWAKRDALRERRLKQRLHRQAALHGYRLVPLQGAV